MAKKVPVVLPEEARWGPKMRALPNDRWRAMVEWLIESGSNNLTEAARQAGFADTPNLKVTASRIGQDERFIAAKAEYGQGKMANLLPLALKAMEEMVADPEHRQRFQAADRILNGSGLHPKTEVHHVQQLTSEEMITKIRSLAEFLKVDPSVLLGGGPVTPLVDVTPRTEEDARKAYEEAQAERLASMPLKLVDGTEI